MGLSCQVLHVFEVDSASVESALHQVLSRHGCSLSASEPVDASTRDRQANSSSPPAYIVGPSLGRWTPVIDLHAQPWPGELCTELSRACSSLVLAIMVHDDSVMYYNLDEKGMSIDGYSSNPQYFEKERISESVAASQHHTPERFEPVLPPGKVVADLLAILNAGWWQAHDQGRLDADGMVTEEDMNACPYAVESDRMISLGAFLELGGPTAEYPFAHWRESREIDGSRYRFLQYRSRRGLLDRLLRRHA